MTDQHQKPSRGWHNLRFGLWFVVSLSFSCGGSPSPLAQLQQDYAKYPEYSIVLQDMRDEGNFFKDYFHQYKIVYGEKAQSESPFKADGRLNVMWTPQTSPTPSAPLTGVADDMVYQTRVTDWQEVSQEEFEKYSEYLGMVLVSKKGDDQPKEAPGPPGYQYVGDPRYGTWRQDARGNSFWEFYGKYAFFSQMFGMFNRPIYQSDWNSYRDYRSRGLPYHGSNHQFGTRGSYTKYTNPTFFERRVAREQAQKARFTDKVRQRVGRSQSSGARSRSSGFGK